MFIRGPPYNAYITKKPSKYTLRNTFIRGPPYNAYKKQNKKNVKIDPQKYFFQGSPL